MLAQTPSDLLPRKIGIVLVTHERLGEAFIEAVSHILGERPSALEAVSTGGDNDHRFLKERLQKACNLAECGAGVLVLVDLFGSTPSNFCCEMIDDTNISAMAGVNLPLLLRAINYRETLSLSALTEALAHNQNDLIQKLSRRCEHDQSVCGRA